MTKLAMLCCLKSNRRCTGAACLSTLNDRTRSFAPYEGQEVTLTAFARCNGCEAGIDKGFQEKLDRLVEDHQSELGLEEALNQAGYSSCAVLLQNGALTVIVASSDMTAEASAAILSLCTAHTDIGVENIRIMAREEP